MAAYDDVVASHYRPSSLVVRTNNEPWDHNQPMRGVPIDQGAVPTMQRYLEETEAPLFAPQWMDEYWMRYPCPSMEAGPSSYFAPELVQHTYYGPQRYCSPTNSGPSSSYMSSSYSDRQSTPLSSPTPSLPCFSPEMTRRDTIPFPFSGYSIPSDEKCDLSGSCVAMYDVQKCPDAQPETFALEEDQGPYYASYNVQEGYVQEGYQPTHMDSEQPEDTPPANAVVTNGDIPRSESPNLRRRRPQAARSATSPHLTSKTKITKRTNGRKRSSSNLTKTTNDKCNGHNQMNPNRAFPCSFVVYGCTSTFGSKNEWKRHINTQHMRLGYWRCDLCDQGERKPNDFNRKDLFIQHIRRMHHIEDNKAVKAKSAAAPKATKNDPEEQALAAAAQRCWRLIRPAPEESGCLFCDVKFNGVGTWDERLEHIGRHMESAKKGNNGANDPKTWENDEALEEWLEREEIIVPSNDGFVLAEGARA